VLTLESEVKIKMSQNTIINQNGEEVTAGNNSFANRLAIREEVRAIAKGMGQSAWYNPATDWQEFNGVKVRPQTVYIGESNSGIVPTWESPVLDMPTFKAGLQKLKSGSTNDKLILEDAFLGEWANLNAEYDYHMSRNNGKILGANVGTNADFAAIDVVNVLATMINTEIRTFVLEQALTSIGTPQLNLRIDKYTRFTASQNVPEGSTPISKAPSVARTSYDLPKSVSHVAFTDEAQLRAVHDIYREAINTAVTDFKRIRSNSIAAELETATSIGGHDWTAFTTDHNTYAPQEDIAAAASVIFANNGAANIIASSDDEWRAFTESTYIKGVLQAVPQPDSGMSKVITNVPAMPGMTWFVDQEKTDDEIEVFDKSAVYLMEGPKRSANYRLELQGTDGYVYRDWFLPKIVNTGRIRAVTGITP